MNNSIEHARRRQRFSEKEAAESHVRGRVFWIRRNLGQRFNFQRDPTQLCTIFSPNSCLQFDDTPNRIIAKNFEFPSKTSIERYVRSKIWGRVKVGKKLVSRCNSIGTGTTISIEEASGTTMELHFYETVGWTNTFHVTGLFFNDKTCSRNSPNSLSRWSFVHSIREVRVKGFFEHIYISTDITKSNSIFFFKSISMKFLFQFSSKSF